MRKFIYFSKHSLILLHILAMLCILSPAQEITPPGVVQMDAPAPATTITENEIRDTLYIFDLEEYINQKPNNRVWQYDVINLVATLQGLVNRDRPQLYIFFVREILSSNNKNVDHYWLEKLRTHSFLQGYDLVYVNTLEELLQIFRDYYTFSVIWDPKVPATGNVALTIAGSDSFLPLRHDNSPDSLFSQVSSLVHPGERLTDKFTAIGNIPDSSEPTTRVKKTDAYLWAKYRYLDSGLCSPSELAFFLDPADWDDRVPGFQYPDLRNTMLVNHDYYIGKKAFFMDLDPWWDEVATDIPRDPWAVGIDQQVLKAILESAYKNTLEGDHILKVGGFVPWWVKYSRYNQGKGKHTELETVEEFISILSAYNCIIDGGGFPFAALANASVYQHFPLKERYFQNPVPPQIPLENRNYILFTIGDFHSSSLLYQAVPTIWEDLSRGVIPIAWAISPFLSERIPHVFDYLYQTRTANDYFVSGSAGAGLSFPNRFISPRVHSDLDDGLYFWERISQLFYQRFDMKISLAANLAPQMIGNASFDEELQRSFISFSPQGVGTLRPFTNPLAGNVTPFVMEKGNFPSKLLDLNATAAEIYKNSKTGAPTFHIYRFNLTNPTTLFYLLQKIQSEHPEFGYQALDPYSFFFLQRQHITGDPASNFYIPTYLSHSIPRTMKKGIPYRTEITLRNDGWDTWNPLGTDPGHRYRLVYSWLYEGEETETPGKIAAYIDKPVPPGEIITLNTQIETPDSYTAQNLRGLYNLILRLEQENVRKSAIEERIRVVIE